MPNLPPPTDHMSTPEKHPPSCSMRPRYCTYCQTILRERYSHHLKKCKSFRIYHKKMKALQAYRQAQRQRPKGPGRKPRAQIEAWYREKRLGPPAFSAIPSRSATKSNAHTVPGWPPVISGGRVESNHHRH